MVVYRYIVIHIICSSCCKKSEHCNIYVNNKKYYHCINCEKHCFEIITEKLKSINLVLYIKS